MKPKMLFVATVFALSVCAAMHAQDAPPPAPPAAATPAPAPPKTRTPEQMLRFYDTKLALTEDQKAQLRPIIADRQQKLEELRADTSARPRVRMKKAKEIEDASDTKINALLTPDQQKKYADLEAQMKEQAKERRQEKTGGN